MERIWDSQILKYNCSTTILYGVEYKRIRNGNHPTYEGEDIVCSAWRHAAVHKRTVLV